ncbi:hypothetical protein HYH03_010537 [Edaphochlamys debaryana]|uniref:Protein kinase domain-containing protein n=1 Tax=Edaphochlamys debaryana TaxID=47281 RepID=A0A835XXZ6_9CHLO|nr:hypothetical protein HYH03_010537 [Edaphochlamys debaryana]|eukprot:KAG2491093.1 hypothetical protein HYH03_010537 [Edaphochlamys debaryana]
MGSCFSAPCPQEQEFLVVEARPSPSPAPAETFGGVPSSPADPPADALQLISIEIHKTRDPTRGTHETLPAGATTPPSTKRTPCCLTKSLYDSLVSSPEEIQLQPPERLLEDVELLCPVGAGSYGVVYKAQYLGAECAVKLVAIEAVADNAHLHEALLSPQLRHPNVVHTYTARAALMTEAFVREVYEEAAGCSRSSTGGLALPSASAHLSGRMLRQESGDGLGPPQGRVRGLRAWSEAFGRLAVKPGQVLVLLAQEYCTQGTLSTAVQSGMFRAQPHTTESFTRRVVLRTAAEICRGMMCLHAANVIHGDLKPGNILLAPSRLDRRGFVAKASAPEALKGQQSRGSDVYSFGVLLYDLMTGKRAFHNLTNARVMMGVCLRGLQPDWPEEQWPELCALARRCCDPDRSQRPSFRDLARELVDMAMSTESSATAAALVSTSAGGGAQRNSSFSRRQRLTGPGAAVRASRSAKASVTEPGAAPRAASLSPSHTTLLGVASALLYPVGEMGNGER